MGRGCRVAVGMSPRKCIGSSGFRHSDQPTVVDHARELRIHNRSPIVQTYRRPDGRQDGDIMPGVHPGRGG